jgi:MFS family permease
MALSWLTVKSYGASGIAALALGYGVPQFLLEVVGGASADRISRRRLFQFTETGFFIVALTLWLASMHGTVPLWLLVTVNACNGAISAFDSPARTALISEMVPQHQWMEAQHLYSISSNITNIFGPALGGVLLSIGTSNRSHEEVAFFFNVLRFVPLLLLIPFLPSLHAVTHAVRSQGESLVRSVAEGLQFVRGQWSLRSLLQLLAVVMLLGMPFQTLLPIFVHGHPAMGGGQSHGYYAALLSAVALGGFVGAGVGDCQLEQGIAVIQCGSGQWVDACGCAAHGCAWIGLRACAGVDGSGADPGGVAVAWAAAGSGGTRRLSHCLARAQNEGTKKAPLGAPDG